MPLAEEEDMQSLLSPMRRRPSASSEESIDQEPNWTTS